MKYDYQMKEKYSINLNVTASSKNKAEHCVVCLSCLLIDNTVRSFF